MIGLGIILTLATLGVIARLAFHKPYAWENRKTGFQNEGR